MTKRLIRFLLLLWIPALLFAPQWTAAQGPVTFVQITDTHVSSASSQEDLRAVLRDIARQKPRPDFLVNTGDLTEFGTGAELRRYRAMMDSSGLPYYSLLGNHDTRWSGLSVRQQREIIGNPEKWSFSYGGVTFIGLNSGLPLEAWGDLDPAQVSWLRRRLARIPRERPVILLAHHPVAFPRRDFLSADTPLFDALEGHNVVLFLVGHGHHFSSWQVNGVPFQMGPSVTNRRGYLVVRIGKDSLRIEQRRAGEPAVLSRRVLPLHRKVWSRPFALSARAEVNSGRVLLRVQVRTGLDIPANSRWQFRRNRGPWLPFSPAVAGGVFADTLTRWSPGWNRVSVRSLAPDGSIWLDGASFGISRNGLGARWRKAFSGRIQAAPLVSAGHLIVAVSGGNARIYALDPATGAERWMQTVPGAVIKSLASSGDTVYAGTTSGFLTALSARSGLFFWRRQFPAPLIGPPLCAGKKLYVTIGGGRVYRLSAASGEEEWHFDTGEMIQSRPALAHGVLFFGGWDRKFHALDAATGREKWSRLIAASRYFAPATPNPLATGSLIIFIPAAPGPGKPSVYACKQATGDTVWTYPLLSHYGSPVRVGNAVVFCAVSGVLYALQPADGGLVWRRNLGEPLFDASPLLHRGTLIVSTLFGTVFLIDPDSGAVRRTFQAGDGFVFASPVAAGNLLIVAGVDGRISALRIFR